MKKSVDIKLKFNVFTFFMILIKLYVDNDLKYYNNIIINKRKKNKIYIYIYLFKFTFSQH